MRAGRPRVPSATPIVLRRTTLVDLPTLRVWDADAEVVASGAGRSAEVWAAELPREVDWYEPLIAELDGEPVGYVELIDAAREESHYWGDDVEVGAWGLDIWVGRPADRARGIGTAIMHAALRRCFTVHRASAVLLDPLPTNSRACRFYERLGFQLLGVRRLGDDDCCVYRMGRDDYLPG